MLKHVVIVDDDELWRTKIASSLAESDEIAITATATHDVAVNWAEEWNGVDVAVVDAGVIRRLDDHFPGVGVVRRIRECRGDTILVVVVTGHYFDDALKWRMREAGADFFYHRADVQEPQALFHAVAHPERARGGVPGIQDPAVAYSLGVGRNTRLNAALDFASEHGLVSGSERHDSPRSRKWIRLRTEFNNVARLHPINADGTIPDRDQSTPSYDQIGRLYRWATRAKTL